MIFRIEILFFFSYFLFWVFCPFFCNCVFCQWYYEPFPPSLYFVLKVATHFQRRRPIVASMKIKFKRKIISDNYVFVTDFLNTIHSLHKWFVANYNSMMSSLLFLLGLLLSLVIASHYSGRIMLEISPLLRKYIGNIKTPSIVEPRIMVELWHRFYNWIDW